MRGPAVGLMVFEVFLLRTGLNVGFRYALPALPPLLLMLYVGSALSVAPHWLGFRSEWVRMRSPGHEALIDSSVDWGQGLIELRDYVRADGLDRVRLSYFGSALPEAYGVAYEPLPSFFPLVPPDLDGPAPAATVISVTKDPNGFRVASTV